MAMTDRPLPARRLLWLAAAWLAAALVASLWPALEPLWWAGGALLLLAALADGVAHGLLPAHIEVAREAPATLAVGCSVELGLTLTNRGRATRLDLLDALPADWETALPQRGLRLARGARAVLRYRARPLRRGLHAVAGVALRLASPLGLWQFQRLHPLPAELRVYPDFMSTVRFELLGAAHQLVASGLHLRRRRGEGLEFHQLRPYREGDSPRQIDWKASSRSGRLVSREYQDERDQHVILVLDCGRRMLAEDAGAAHFDQALAALLLLDHVAQAQGDAVGLMTFATATPRFLPPRRRGRGDNALLNQLFDVDPGTRAPDFQGVATELQTRLTRRSLVVFLSNLRDEDEAELAPALQLLARRHLVLFASLREAALDRALAAPVEDAEGALLAGAAALYDSQRRLAHARLVQAGVRIFDATPAALPMALVNAYLAEKRAGRL